MGLAHGTAGYTRLGKKNSPIDPTSIRAEASSQERNERKERQRVGRRDGEES